MLGLQHLHQHIYPLKNRDLFFPNIFHTCQPDKTEQHRRNSLELFLHTLITRILEPNSSTESEQCVSLTLHTQRHVYKKKQNTSAEFNCLWTQHSYISTNPCSARAWILDNSCCFEALGAAVTAYGPDAHISTLTHCRLIIITQVYHRLINVDNSPSSRV